MPIYEICYNCGIPYHDNLEICPDCGAHWNHISYPVNGYDDFDIKKQPEELEDENEVDQFLDNEEDLDDIDDVTNPPTEALDDLPF